MYRDRDRRVTSPLRDTRSCAADDNDDEGLRYYHGDAETYAGKQQHQQSQTYHKQRQRSRKSPRPSRGSLEKDYSHSEGLEFPQFVVAIEGVIELLTVGHDGSVVGDSGVGVGDGDGGRSEGRRGEDGCLKADASCPGESAGGILRGRVITMTLEVARTCLVRLAQVREVAFCG